MLSMADLEPHIVEVEFDIVEGDVSSKRTAKFKLLSYSEYIEIGEDIPYPDVPIVPMEVDGKKKYVPDPNNVDYQTEVADVNHRRTLLRLACSLVEGGTFPELVGLPLAEQAEAIGRLPYAVLLGLQSVMVRLHRMRHSEVMAQSKNFLGIRDSEGADLQGAGVGSGEVAELAAD